MPLDYQDGYGDTALLREQLIERLQFSVIEGCEVTPGTDPMTVACDAGRQAWDGTRFNVSAQDNVALEAADPNEPRRDTVYLDGNSQLQVATGDPEAPRPEANTHEQTFRPAPRDLATTNATVLAEVWVPAGADDVGLADIRDRRLFADAVFGEVVADALTADTVAAGSATIDGTIAHHALTSLLLSADQTIPTGTWTQIEWDTTSDDDLPGFDAATHTFVAPADGRYAIDVTGMFTTWDPAEFAFRVRVNGANVGEAWYQPQAGSGFISEQLTVTVNISAGDEIDTLVQQGTGADQTLDSSNARTWCDIIKVG